MQDKARIGAWLTFRGKAGKSMEWLSASSFTSRENALGNLNGENYMFGGLDFNSMMQFAAEFWCERFHTIDVESKNLSKVNQFYGALYRSSFLPHEISDVNGDYPEFSTGTQVDYSVYGNYSPYNALKKYGDFSRWDIYRAE